MPTPLSPPSLWIGRRRPAEAVETAVVGGGIVGLSTAWWLAREGEARGRRAPVVLEAGPLAGRASGRNAGFLLTGSPQPYGVLEEEIGAAAARAFWELSRDNRELLRREVLDPGRVDCELQAEGSWLGVVDDPVADPDQLAAEHRHVEESAQRLRDLGFEVEWRTGEAVEAASGTPRVRKALFQPRDGGLDPVALCRGLAGEILEAGGRVRTGARVHALEAEPGGRTRIVADGGDLLAERVVVAVNAYAPALLPELLPEVRPVRGQMLATAPGPRVLSGVWYLNRGFEYVRQLPDGTMVVGGCRRVSEAEEKGYGETPTASVQGALDRFLARTWPAVAERPVARRWAGTMAFTRDGLPRIGVPQELPGVLYAAGFNGHGMSLGFVTGRYLARRALGGDIASAAPLLPAAG